MLYARDGHHVRAIGSPASHGTVRVTIADSDWMVGSISNSAGVVYLEIVGTS